MRDVLLHVVLTSEVFEPLRGVRWNMADYIVYGLLATLFAWGVWEVADCSILLYRDAKIRRKK